MAQFQIIGDNTRIDQICIDSSPNPENGGQQRRVKLELSHRSHANPPDFFQLDSLIRIGGISYDKTNRSTRFWIEPTPNARGTDVISAFGVTLRVVVGKVTNQDQMKCDLIADLGRSEDPRILQVYQRILAARNNNEAIPREDWDHSPTEWSHPGLADQPFKQITDEHKMRLWNCGSILTQFSRANFAHSNIGNVPYYRPFYSKPNQQRRVLDIVFDAGKVKRGVERIKALLDQKTAVRVYAVHGEEGFGVTPNGAITNPWTHFLTIVGYSVNEKTFLVIDPWPSGSTLYGYTSGIFGTVRNIFMGYLYYFPEDNRIASLSIKSLEEENHQLRSGQRVPRLGHQYVLLTGPA